MIILAGQIIDAEDIADVVVAAALTEMAEVRIRPVSAAV